MPGHHSFRRLMALFRRRKGLRRDGDRCRRRDGTPTGGLLRTPPLGFGIHGQYLCRRRAKERLGRVGAVVFGSAVAWICLAAPAEGHRQGDVIARCEANGFHFHAAEGHDPRGGHVFDTGGGRLGPYTPEVHRLGRDSSRPGATLSS